MRFYELTCLISPDLSQEELKNFSKNLGGFIVQENGILKQEIEPSKQRLAYPIKKKTEAFLLSLNFQLNPGDLEKIEKHLKSEARVLRYNILAKQSLEKRPEKPRRVSPRKALEADEEKPERLSEKPKGIRKVELKEIDKKIEEILKE